MSTELEIPPMAMEVLGILWERETHTLPVARTETDRTIQRAVGWLQGAGYVTYIGDDLWQITEAGDRFFVGQAEREA